MRPQNICKHLEIGNYPPPYDGWELDTRFVVDEIRRRGHTCEVLKINENRHQSPKYIDVQSGIDYLQKVFRFGARGYASNTHVNAGVAEGLHAGPDRGAGGPLAASKGDGDISRRGATKLLSLAEIFGLALEILAVIQPVLRHSL